MSMLADAALAAHDAGLSVIPIKADGTKGPPFPWAEFQIKPADRSQVEKWFGQPGFTGYAIVCGPVSGNLEGLDFDDADIFEGFVELGRSAGLGNLLARIQDGYEELTPDGGAHLLYRCSEIAGNTVLAARPRSDDPRKPLPLIETRGAGGYMVAAPTNGAVHPSGRPWNLVAGSVDTITTITPDERATLFDVARSFDEMPKQTGERPQSAATLSPARPGDDYRMQNGDLSAWRSLMESAGWTWV